MPRFPKTPLPVKNATSSYWMSHASPALSQLCSDDELPNHIEVVIIGSGITGALIADNLITRAGGETSSLLMLEARSLCSGATGRNGGHIKPDCYRTHNDFRRRFDVETAKSLTAFELLNMEETAQFIREQGLDRIVDLVETRSADIYMNEAAWKEARSSYNAYAEVGGNVKNINVHEPTDSSSPTFPFKSSYGAVSYPAYSLWPYKLAVSILEKSIRAGLKVFTNTPVSSIDPDTRRPGQWLLTTSKGQVTCSKIYHATNGYASALLPDFSRDILPVKGHVAAIEPAEPYKSSPISTTHGIQWGEDFDYFIQRPNDGNPIIFGGRDLAHPRGLAGVIGDSDDSTLTPEIVEALAEFPAKYMENWIGESRLRYAWSGIMGFTPDGLPFLGDIPGRPGQYIAAGFNGHGMARVFLSARAVVQLSHGEEVDVRVPKPYYDVESRRGLKVPEWEELMRLAVCHEKSSQSKL